MPLFKVAPETFGLTPEQGEALYEQYVVEEKTVAVATHLASKKLRVKIPEARAAKFIRANGWTRPRSYYARRNPFKSLTRANIEGGKAAIKRRGQWVD